MMNILVVNDDGVNAKGIKILALALRKYGKVTVCAPLSGRSASGHSIVLHSSLSFELIKHEDEIDWYATDAMPADCTRLAVALLNDKFDIVFSGVNNGLNLGTDIIYSGTVAAAREANIENINSVAISTDFDCFDIVENEIDDLLKLIFDSTLYSKKYVLNVNFPTANYKKSKGYKFCRQGIKRFKTTFEKQEDRYINKDSFIVYDQNEDTDVYLADKGYITFVPLKVEQTNYESLEKLKLN